MCNSIMPKTCTYLNLKILLKNANRHRSLLGKRCHQTCSRQGCHKPSICKKKKKQQQNPTVSAKYHKVKYNKTRCACTASSKRKQIKNSYHEATDGLGAEVSEAFLWFLVNFHFVVQWYFHHGAIISALLPILPMSLQSNTQERKSDWPSRRS